MNLSSLDSLTDRQLDAVRQRAVKLLRMRRDALRGKVKSAKLSRKWTKRRKPAPKPYVEYIASATFCYACGKPRGYRHSWFAATNTLDPMHFVHSGTGRCVRDIRLVIPACRACHDHAHHENADCPLPQLTDANAAWLKRYYEPENYNPAFIALNNNGKEIEPAEYLGATT